MEYTLLYDTIASRISIDEVEAKDGKLRLIEKRMVEYDKLPHMLIAGGTGGGKTYFILTLIEACFIQIQNCIFLTRKMLILRFRFWMANVYYRKKTCFCIETSMKK